MSQEPFTWLTVRVHLLRMVLYRLALTIHVASGNLADAAHANDILLLPQPSCSAADPLVSMCALYLVHSSLTSGTELAEVQKVLDPVSHLSLCMRELLWREQLGCIMDHYLR